MTNWKKESGQSSPICISTQMPISMRAVRFSLIDRCNRSEGSVHAIVIFETRDGINIRRTTREDSSTSTYDDRAKPIGGKGQESFGKISEKSQKKRPGSSGTQPQQHENGHLTDMCGL
jgi:hypothetical protein